tara:strand:+ start:282 stop:707 length:426 start_codon:yes stop_codon:yes gene_type:complete
MNDSQQIDADRRASTALGLRYGRIAGHVLALLLLFLGLSALFNGTGVFEAFKGVYFIAYGIVLSLPYTRLSDKSWRWCFVLLVGLSALFVFVMVVVVIFAYMASDARGERLGVPGFEGSLIFLALLQVPVVLFQRKPDMLD